MSINSISAAEKYSGELDRVFEAKSATAFLADNALRTNFVGAKTVIIPEVAFDGLSDYDRTKGFTDGAVNVSGTPYTMTMDRARSLTIDREDMDETGIANLAGKILGEYVRTKVVPECDAYAIAKISRCAIDKGNLIDGDLAAPYDTFCRLVNEVQSVVGYDEELVCFMDSAAYSRLMSSDEISRVITVSDFKQGEMNLKVKSINGIAIIPVVNERMKTAFNFNGGAAGGFAPADGASSVHMLVLPKTAAHLVKKTEKMRIFTPEQNTSADAYKFDYRIYYDVFVKASSADAVWAFISAPLSITEQPADVTVNEGAISGELSVAASSDGDSSVTYQWYKAELADGTNAARLIGETKNTLTIPKELTEGEHYFFCKITADGVNTQRSEVATVTVA